MNDRQQNLRRQYDLCQRYGLLARVLEAAFPSGAVAVLDVGAGAEDLSRAWLPDRFAITLADASTFGRSDITLLQPGEPLPFRDRSFDAVLAMDVLEHVPAADRDGLVREFARVAGAAVVLSHPTATDAVVAADRLLASAHQSWLRAASTFLDEHAGNGLPPDTVATSALAAAGLPCATFPNCPIVDWLPFTVLDVALLATFGTGGPKDAFNLAANSLASDLRTPGEHYRTFTVGTRDAGMLARVDAAVRGGQQERTAEHDRKIAELLARTLVQLAESPLIEGLRQAVVAKDEHIGKLGALLQGQAFHTEGSLAAKDEHIRKLEALLQEQRDHLLADFAAIVRAKDEHIRKLDLLLRNPNAPH